MMHTLGRHLLVECYDCDPKMLDDKEFIERMMLDAAHAAGATVLAWAFHQFSPQGVSGAVIIAESHLSIHTWPEHGYAAVDVFTCGDRALPDRAVEFIKDYLKTRIEIKDVLRGIING